MTHKIFGGKSGEYLAQNFWRKSAKNRRIRHVLHLYYFLQLCHQHVSVYSSSPSLIGHQMLLVTNRSVKFCFAIFFIFERESCQWWLMVTLFSVYMFSIVGIYGSHFTFSHTLSLNQMHEIPAIISVRPQLPFVSDPNLTDGIQVAWVPLQVYYLQACCPKLFIQSTFSSMLGITPTLLSCKEQIHYSLMQSYFITNSITPSDM